MFQSICDIFDLRKSSARGDKLMESSSLDVRVHAGLIEVILTALGAISLGLIMCNIGLAFALKMNPITIAFFMVGTFFFLVAGTISIVEAKKAYTLARSKPDPE